MNYMFLSANEITESWAKSPALTIVILMLSYGFVLFWLGYFIKGIFMTK